MSLVADRISPVALKKDRLSDLIFERLAEAFVEGEFAPGEVLRDKGLAERLGVSRMPVREAVLRLERAGLVEMAASRYTKVTPLTSERIASVVEYAGYTYGAAGRLATIHASDDDRARFVHVLSQATSDREPANLVKGMQAFCRVLIDSSDNEVFALRGDIDYLVDFVTRHMPHDDMAQRILDTHTALEIALLSKDGDTVETAIRFIHGIA